MSIVRISLTASTLAAVTAVGVASCSDPIVVAPGAPQHADAGSALASVGSLHAFAATGSPETLVWTDRTAAINTRLVPSLVDEPQLGKVLLYGGWTIDSGVRADTWEWDGFGWFRRVPEQDPGPRFGAATAYDEGSARVLMYGGIRTFSPAPAGTDQYTWEWNGQNWAPIVTEHAPSLRAGSAMTWDPMSKRIVLFGGFSPAVGDETRALGDDSFWAFDGHDWTELPKSGTWPTPRGLGALVANKATGHLVLHGGFNYLAFTGGKLNLQDGTKYVNDTWEWDGTSWTQLPGILPDIGLGAPSLAFEPATNEVTLFVDGFAKRSLYGLVDGEWVERQTITSDRAFSAATWSSVNQGTLITGGTSRDATGLPSGGTLAGEFLVSSTTPFKTYTPPLEPRSRIGAAGATIRSTGECVVYGGRDETNVVLAQTMIWDGGRWATASSPDPGEMGSRERHAMAPLGADQVLLFGGASAGDFPTDTWIWSTKTKVWRKVGGTGPAGRINHAMAAVGDDVVLFGGDQGGLDQLLDDTWLFDEATGWRQIPTSTAPDRRTFVRATSTPDGQSAFFFGGADATNTSVGTAWRFDGTRWTLVNDYAPLLRRSGVLATDAQLGRIYMIGGTGSTGQSDGWDFTDAIGQPMTPVVREDNQELPLRRHDAVGLANPASGGVIEFSGQSNEGGKLLAETWQLESYGAKCTQASECSTGQACTDGVCCEATSCGPCRTCASPDHPGLCSAKGTFGQEPGCDGERSCNELGQCRLANEATCSTDLACASATCLRAGRDAGICCSAEGCAVRCVNGELQGPDGTPTSCAPYGCEGQRCNTSCRSADECADGYVCTAEGTCLPTKIEASQEGCSCRVPGGRSSLPAGALGFGVGLGLAAWLRRTRRSERTRPIR